AREDLGELAVTFRSESEGHERAFVGLSPKKGEEQGKTVLLRAHARTTGARMSRHSSGFSRVRARAHLAMLYRWVEAVQQRSRMRSSSARTRQQQGRSTSSKGGAAPPFTSATALSRSSEPCRRRPSGGRG